MLTPALSHPTLAAPASQAGARKRKALSSLTKLPPFSPILNKLLATLAGEEVSFTKLGDLIEKDTVVAGNILRVVNSAMYARRNTVNSVRHALSVLGVDKVRNVVLGMSISRMLNQVRTPRSFSMARFNRHSAAVAILSDTLAPHVRCEYPEGAFVAGLLHDVGRLLTALALPEDYDAMLYTYRHTERSWIDCETETLGFAHPELSAEVLLAWKLPEPIVIAARDHHVPPPDDCMPLSRVLNAANQLVNSLGDSILDNQRSDFAGSAWIESLGLRPEVLDRVITEYQTEHAAMSEFFR